MSHPLHKVGLSAVGALVALVLIYGTALGSVAPLPDPLRVQGGIKPEPASMPARSFVPVGLSGSAKVVTTLPVHIPALRQATLRLDSDLRVAPRRLPPCRYRVLQAASTTRAKRVCSASVVGSGKISVSVDGSVGNKAVDMQSPMPLFFGGFRDRVAVVFGHAQLDPESEPLTLRALIYPSNGRKGSLVKVTIPSVANGQGSLLSLSVKFRRFARSGRRAPRFLMARCSDRSLSVQIQRAIFISASTDADLPWGRRTSLRGELSAPCHKRS